MNSILVQLLLGFLVILGAKSGFAICDGCTEKNNLILFPHGSVDAQSEIYVGWNYEGALDVSYKDLLENREYATNVRGAQQINGHRAANYLTDKDGNVLVAIPESNPSSPTGGMYGAAGESSQENWVDLYEDQEHTFVYYGLTGDWATHQILIYRVEYQTDGKMKLTEIKHLNKSVLLATYNLALGKNYGSGRDSAQFHQDETKLSTTFTVARNSKASVCGQDTLPLVLNAETFVLPAEAKPDSFHVYTRFEVCLSFTDSLGVPVGRIEAFQLGPSLAPR